MDVRQSEGAGSDETGTLLAVADGVYGWIQPDGSWWINNAGVVATADQVVLIDTCATERRTRNLLRAVDRATGGTPVRYGVNTHLHGDHTYGNSLLPQTAMIVGHEATRAGILADTVIDGCPPFWQPVPDWGQVTRRAPDLTFRTTLTLHAGGRRIELHHPGYAAHTPGDAVAWLPEERVLFAGDLLFHQVTPLVFMGSVAGALRSLDWIAEFEPEHVVPGHGPLIDARTLPEVLDAHRRYYHLILATAKAGLSNGLTPLEAARTCELGPLADLPDAERIVLNLHRAYADSTGSDFDLLSVFADAIAYNGGPLPTQV